MQSQMSPCTCSGNACTRGSCPCVKNGNGCDCHCACSGLNADTIDRLYPQYPAKQEFEPYPEGWPRYRPSCDNVMNGIEEFQEIVGWREGHLLKFGACFTSFLTLRDESLLREGRASEPCSLYELGEDGAPFGRFVIWLCRKILGLPNPTSPTATWRSVSISPNSPHFSMSRQISSS
jgi:hypothetical protein